MNDDRFALKYFGLRFVSRAIELDFNVWRLDAIIPFFRAICFIGLLTWIVLPLVIYDVSPNQASDLLRQAPLFAALMFIGLWASWTTKLKRLIPNTIVVISMAMNLALILHRHEIMNYADPGLNLFHATGTALIGIAVMTTVTRLGIGRVLIAVLPSCSLLLYFAFDDLATNAVSELVFRSTIGLLSLGLASGILGCITLDVITRKSYVQRQILDSQQQLIRRYAPQAVAEHIDAGDDVSIDVPQRLRVTILFCDIVGFTDIADRVEPEVMTEVLNDYMSTMADVIEAHGGTLNEFAGDGLMALFGAPDKLPPEEQAVKAVAAARAMQSTMPELNDRWRKLGLGADLNVRIGINTGMASVGSYGSEGRMTYTAIGLQTNIASRIESAAEPGQILISDATYQLIHGDIDCDPRGEVECKGVHFPVKVYAPRGWA